MTLINNNQRINFASARQHIEYPDFLDIQLKSFQEFFQLETTPESREHEGLYRVFMDNFPITDARNNFVLEFLDYFIDPPRYSIPECLERGLSYSVPLKAKLKLYCTDPEHEDFETQIQDVYLGMIPYMTPKGTFVINGAERVIVSQLHRSPGVFFGTSRHANGTQLYSARVIPFKGSWIEFATDINNVMYAYIDRKKKLPVTTLLRAIGFHSDKDILEIFDLADEIKVSKAGLKRVLGRRLAAKVLRTWVEDFVDEDTGEVVSIERTEVIVERETTLESAHIQSIVDSGAKTIILHKEDSMASDYSIIFNTLQKDTSNSEKEAVEFIYRQLRNAEPPDEETARSIINNLFFSEKRYDLGMVGRFKINRKLNLDVSEDTRILTNLDIIEIIKHLVRLINSKTEVDDIDHLSNRRVRTVGEQLQNQFGVGLARMARTIRERMNVRDNEVFTPIELINAKTLSSVINSFFGTNALSQFMDQTNPLSEITHKRRISALGPGGLSRERAGFEVRDVHFTHYGRLCTIETPEGPNIGLISSLAVFSQVNSLGFLETPYKKVEDGIVKLDEPPIFLTADDEEEYQITHSKEGYNNETGELNDDRIKVRKMADYPIVPKTEVQLMDVASNQIASIAASLIPFLEHDDANRALMGSNMQRQAVPCLRADAPVAGTGMERVVAVDSQSCVVAKRGGLVDSVDASRIVIRVHDEEAQLGEGGVDIYNLMKYTRSNQNTCMNQRPIVRVGDIIERGDVLADGSSTDLGELALGQNMLIAFMPWNGYNFEDSILLSENVVKEDRYTTIHIEELSCLARDTKLGPEEITADIPNVSESQLAKLDECGIIHVGAEVKGGDVLVGKVTPKGETQLSPEEKLLRAIFGEKASDVKDTSLRMKSGVTGTVLDVQVFTRDGVEKDNRALQIEDAELEKFRKDLRDELRIYRDDIYERAAHMMLGKQALKGPAALRMGGEVSQDYLDNIDQAAWLTISMEDDSINEQLELLARQLEDKKSSYEKRLQRQREKITAGDDLAPGVLKMVKVYVAIKRRMQPGDKMAGRHGNKGVVSRIVPVEDMPYMADGRPVDICLNPLGVPSRMNVGQVLETHLGWAAKGLGEKIGRMIDVKAKTDELRQFICDIYDTGGNPKQNSQMIAELSDEEIVELATNLRRGVTMGTQVFDGADEEEIRALLRLADLPETGQTDLYDGHTGEKFERQITVGYMHMLKLNHLVDDKMHARSTGPYSLVTQQPLGGKAQFGGQRLGEMEVWALEAYGAAYTLQEMLTVKSDDVQGRNRMYKNVVDGDHRTNPGMPESFNVLMKEIRSLGLNIELESD